MIRFTSLSKIFPGNIPGLVDITTEIPEGSFVFLIGPSGSGKTTFLRLLLRDLIPSTGSLHIDEWNLGQLPASKVHLLRRKVSVVFQDFKLLTDRTIFENIAIVPEILGKTSQEVEHAVTNVLSLVGLPHKRNMFPSQLSAGELQRISIARAIVGGPKILLADEPTGNLDPDTSWEILNILQEVNNMGTTIIMASHNADIVNKLKKRTLTLQSGKIVSDEEKGKYKTTKKESVSEEPQHAKEEHQKEESKQHHKGGHHARS